MTEEEFTVDSESYWGQEHHPRDLPMPEREAWHRDAWDREQVELYQATRNGANPAYTPPPVENVGEVWQR